MKLVDYITFNSKVSMMNYSTEVLTKNLEDFVNKSSQSRLSPWLVCKVTNNDDEILFKPDKEQSLEIFEEIVQKGIEAICLKNKFFIHRPDIRVFTDSDVAFLSRSTPASCWTCRRWCLRTTSSP